MGRQDRNISRMSRHLEEESWGPELTESSFLAHCLGQVLNCSMPSPRRKQADTTELTGLTEHAYMWRSGTAFPRNWAITLAPGKWSKPCVMEAAGKMGVLRATSRVISDVPSAFVLKTCSLWCYKTSSAADLGILAKIQAGRQNASILEMCTVPNLAHCL